jgi:uncharacterized membrane protein YidH (DUF202 family)
MPAENQVRNAVHAVSSRDASSRSFWAGAARLRHSTPDPALASPKSTILRRGGQAIRPMLPWASAIALVAVLATGGLFVYAHVFGTFWDGDDEGVVMMTSRLLLDGHAMYDDVATIYGPFYHAARWLPFGLLRLPLTHDMVRVLTCTAWLGCAAAVAIVVLRIARRRRDRFWLAAIGAAMAILLPRAMRLNPGHPQELVILGVALGLLAASFANERRLAWVWTALGAIAAALILTKLNVGIFFAAACVLTLAAGAPQGTARRVLTWLVVAASLALPFVLMRSQFNHSWVQALCLRTELAIVLCLWLALGRCAGSPCGIRPWGWFGLGMAATAAASVAFAMAQGASWHGMAACLLIDPMRLVRAETGSLTLSLKPWAAFAAAVSAALAISTVYAQGRFRDFLDNQLLGWVKLGVVALGRRAIINDPGILVQCGPLFCWLVLIVPRGRQASFEERLFRRLLCFLAVFQSLQIYPLPGDSQIGVGSIALVPLGIVLLIDWMEGVCTAFPRIGAALAGLGSAALGLLSLKALAIFTFLAVTAFRQYDAVTLPGCRLMRMPEEQLAIQRCLVENVRLADDSVSRIGSNSLYFWTERRPLDLTVVGWSWNTIPDERQRRLIEKYRAAGDVLAINHAGAVERSAWRTTRFGRFVETEFQPVASIGAYTLLRRTDLPERPVVYCATSEPGQWVWNNRITTADGGPIRLRLVLPDSGLLDRVAECVVLVPRLEEDVLGAEQCEQIPGVVLLSHGADLDGGARGPVQSAPAPGRSVGLVVEPVESSAKAWRPVLRLYDEAGRRLLTVPIALGGVPPAEHLPMACCPVRAAEP